ncbi:MAG: FlgD immunoglobulin-like domain containing protein, partial [Candidatus Cloacimonetes bacterium]|nr:FlgD immunoglobulin-like domain containing protein [Candidatus Cloacimonadota bacterium]
GIYTVTATAAGYDSLTQENIAVAPNQNSTVNFLMVPTSNEDENVPITVTALRGNYPNPFNPETTISYDIKDAGSVRLAVYNVKGQLVRSLVNTKQAAGRYRVIFNGCDDRGKPLSSGIYLYRFTAGRYSSTRKMMLME